MTRKFLLRLPRPWPLFAAPGYSAGDGVSTINLGAAQRLPERRHQAIARARGGRILAMRAYRQARLFHTVNPVPAPKHESQRSRTQMSSPAALYLRENVGGWLISRPRAATESLTVVCAEN
jgi:hypothetical protein